MHSRLLMLLISLFIAVAAPPALANNDGLVLWDHNIASAISAGLPEEDRCSASPYALYGPRCHAQLNLSFDRPINYFTFLDRAALFLYNYHELKYNQNLWDNTKLRFHLNLKNVYKQEARAGIGLRIRFSSAAPRSGLLPGAAPIALAPPSSYAN